MDWGDGNYELFATDLRPVAPLLADAVGAGAEMHVVDVGCGTGNATLELAARGADVTGVDPAPRLLAVAQDAATDRGLADRVAFVEGEAEALPVADGAADAIVSLFGVIFAADARAAIRELRRIGAPGARLALSAWLPRGAIGRLVTSFRAALPPQPHTGADSGVDWGDAGSLTDAFAEQGITIELQEHGLPFRHDSAEAWLRQQHSEHPVWRQLGRQLDPERLREVTAEQLAILGEENEDRDAFLVTSPYLIVTATLPGPVADGV